MLVHCHPSSQATGVFFFQECPLSFQGRFYDYEMANILIHLFFVIVYFWSKYVSLQDFGQSWHVYHRMKIEKWKLVYHQPPSTVLRPQLMGSRKRLITSCLCGDSNLDLYKIVCSGRFNSSIEANALNPWTKQALLKINIIVLYFFFRMLLPMLLNQCAQGWVNNIIFTSQTKAPVSSFSSLSFF